MFNVLTPSLPARVEDDQDAWRAFRYHSRTFSMATWLLPRAVQTPVATIYLFCRRVDNVADQLVLDVGAEEALVVTETMRQKLDATLNGSPPDGFLWQRLHHVHQQYALPSEPLYELLEGARWDLQGRTVQTRDDLIQYSNLVGGSVGAMVLPFLMDGDAATDLEPAARALGIGMQITNILRDVGEDLRTLDRIYLPREVMARYQVRVADLRKGEPTRRYVELVEALMRLAERYYDAAQPGIDALPTRCRLGIRSAARMYREILNRIRASDYDNLTYRAYVPFWKKCTLVLRDGYPHRRDKLQAVSPPSTTADPVSVSVASD